MLLPHVAELIARAYPKHIQALRVSVFSRASTDGSHFVCSAQPGSLVTTIEQVNEQYSKVIKP